MEQKAVLNLRVDDMKGVHAKKRILEIDGTPHELRVGENQIALPPGRHSLKTYMRAPIGNKICMSKPLVLDLATGQTADVVYHMVGGAFSREFRLEVSGQDAPPPAPVAWWAWLFVVPCIAIPIVALGGAIPVVLGVLGAGGCLSVAKARTSPAPVRVLICLAITVACWTVFGLIISAFARM